MIYVVIVVLLLDLQLNIGLGSGLHFPELKAMFLADPLGVLVSIVPSLLLLDFRLIGLLLDVSDEPTRSGGP